MSINQYDLNRKKNNKIKYRLNLKDCKQISQQQDVPE